MGAPADQAQPPAEVPPEDVPFAVIAAPDGASSHHLAPNELLPWPLVVPGPESLTK